jgi:hypothetical protein
MLPFEPIRPGINVWKAPPLMMTRKNFEYNSLKKG